MKNPYDVWLELQKGKKLKIEDVAKAIYCVDVSDYVKTVNHSNLPRYRKNKVGCDGTALLTLKTLCEMIEPILEKRVYDKEKGNPNGSEVGIIYTCSPIEYDRSIESVGFNMVQVDSFSIRYASEFLYQNRTVM